MLAVLDGIVNWAWCARDWIVRTTIPMPENSIKQMYKAHLGDISLYFRNCHLCSGKSQKLYQPNGLNEPLILNLPDLCAETLAVCRNKIIRSACSLTAIKEKATSFERQIVCIIHRNYLHGILPSFWRSLKPSCPQKNFLQYKF